MQALACLAFWGRKWPCLRGGTVTAKTAAEVLQRNYRDLSWCYLFCSWFLHRNHTNLEECLDWQWSNSLSSSLWHSSLWPKQNYEHKGLDLVWNQYIVLWGKRSDGRTGRVDRQSCPSNSSLAGNTYTTLVADTSQQEVPTVSSINFFLWLFLYWQHKSLTHPLPLYSEGSKCKWKTSPSFSVESIVKSVLHARGLSRLCSVAFFQSINISGSVCPWSWNCWSYFNF